MKPKSLKTLLISICAAISMQNYSWAVGGNGLTVQVTGVRPLGMGNAFAGLADDPTANYFNPAGLNQLDGLQTTVGLTGVAYDADYEGQGLSDSMHNSLSFVPNLFVTSRINDKWAAGFGVDVPFGLGTEWDKTSTMRYAATKSELTCIHYNPNISYAAADNFSVAAGIDYLQVQKAKLDNQFDQSFVGGTDGTQSLEGNGGDWGYNLAALWKIKPQHSFGVSYRSQIDVKVKGDFKLSNIDPTLQGAGNFSGADYSTGVETKIPFAQSVLLGYAFKPNDRWTVLLDYEWTDWSKLKSLDLDIKENDPTRKAFLTASGSSVDYSWRDSNTFAIGTEYTMKNQVKLRGGYSYFPTVVPERTWNPSLPESNTHNFSVGAGIPVKKVILDFAYYMDLFEKRKVNTDIAEGNQVPTVDGTYKTIAYLFGVSATYKFGGSAH